MLACDCRSSNVYSPFIIVFFFNDTATTEIYTLSLHDALPIYRDRAGRDRRRLRRREGRLCRYAAEAQRAAARQSEEAVRRGRRSEEHTSELQSRRDLVCRLLLEKKKTIEVCIRS